jgi:hypothetical protein
MLIELHIRRFSKRRNKPGSQISMDKKVYEFEPNPELTDGDEEAHVADVQDPNHIKRFLSIREYTVYGDQPEPDEEETFDPEDYEPPEEEKPAELTEEEVDLEAEMCETIISMTVSEAKEHLSSLSDQSLGTLTKMERAGKARSSLLDAIEDELQSRKE